MSTECQVKINIGLVDVEEPVAEKKKSS